MSNVLPVAEGETQPLWYEGVLSAFAGGAVSGAFAGACVSNPFFSSLSVVAQNVIGNTLGTLMEEAVKYIKEKKEVNSKNVGETIKNVIVSATVGSMMSDTINIDNIASKSVKLNYDTIAKRGVEIANCAVSGAISFAKNIISKLTVSKQSSNFKISSKGWWK